MADTSKAGIKRMAAMKAIREMGDLGEVLKPVRPEGVVETNTYDAAASGNKSGRGMGVYVLHTYAGYEKKVKDNIVKAVANRHLEDKIIDVMIPEQDVTEVRATGKKVVRKKVLPGYVLVRMDADDNDAWYVVRNTRGVTGFVGPGGKPVPLSDEEVERMLSQEHTIKAEFAVGDMVVAVDGAWKDAIGRVTRIDENKHTATIMMEMFGRETPVEIDFSDLKKYA